MPHLSPQLTGTHALVTGVKASMSHHVLTMFAADVLGLVTLIEASILYRKKRNGADSIVVISSLAAFEAKKPAIRDRYTTLKRAQATVANDYG
ncbi:hypothetical protein FGRMN_6702 [Fusarium graminum]|nr:hypothetical protein FGRMN_6702 [Fusarium graminum]